jgi:SAM-dependent methyltransferase
MKLLDRILQRWRIRKARPYVAAGSRVLDIGCADGELFRRLPGIADGVGVDPDLPDSLAPAADTRFLRGMFPAVLPDGQPFDVITMLAVLEHVPPDRQHALALDCARHLKPGGYLVITVPSPAVDYILAVLRFFRLIHGMALEQHYGYEPAKTGEIFSVGGLELVASRRFQLGLNNLFVFKKTAAAAQRPAPAARPEAELEEHAALAS